jgi:hypothetical protein
MVPGWRRCMPVSSPGRPCSTWAAAAASRWLGVWPRRAIGHQLTLQLAWAADNANTALAGFLETARQIAGQTIQPRLVPGDLPPAEP